MKIPSSAAGVASSSKMLSIPVVSQQENLACPLSLAACVDIKIYESIAVNRDEQIVVALSLWAVRHGVPWEVAE